MRDHQKDERELSIKKAFLDDVLSENRLLTIILKRSGSDRVVLWDLESLPSLTKVPELCSTSSTVVTAPKDNASSDNENKNNQDLLRDMSLYMETVNDLYMNDSDLSGDFQLDSGSLPCVACGILGFPFMTVVQPSERASVNLLQDVGVSKHDHSPSPLANGLVDPVPDGVRENIEPYGCNLLHHLNGELESQFENEWCSTRGFLRPRIFCLEHAIHIVDILDCRGGANVLVICHSDFKKMRAHAAVISEQIGTPFRYYEAPLDNATQGDLNLIDLAVDNEEHNKYGKDWTSKVNINLQHCVKLRKSFPCKQEHQYALALGGLFSETKSSSETTDLNWQFTKSRSKCNRKKSFDPIRMEKPSMGSSTESMLRGKDQVLVVQSVANIIKDEVKLIQYSRRRFNCKPGSSISIETVTEQDRDVAPVVDSGNQNEYDIERSLKGVSVETLSTGDKSSGLSIPIYNGNPELRSGSGVSVSSQTVCSVTPGTQNVEANSKDPTTVEDLDMHHEIKVDKICLNIGTFDAENSSFSVVAAAEDTQQSIVQKENVGFLGNGEDQSSEGIVSRKGTAEDRGKEPVEANNNAPSDQSSLVSNVSIEVSITNVVLEIDNNGYHSSPDKGELDNAGSTMVCQKPNAKNRSKRRRESDLLVDNQNDFDSFIRSPCERLRPRSSKHAKTGEKDSRNAVKENPAPKKTRKSLNSSVVSVSSKHRKSHWCDEENCSMKFHTKEELSLHKGNRCPIKGCGKRFSSHKYTVLHQRVHDDDRPLKCPWNGCDMSFKWAWSRIEHIRLHTGERPYCCKVDGCGLTFRFISDFSRHRRKTGHYVTSSAR